MMEGTENTGDQPPPGATGTGDQPPPGAQEDTTGYGEGNAEEAEGPAPGDQPPPGEGDQPPPG